MEILLNNIVGILGFGFLGLSFLFVYLAYTNVRQIVAQPNPSDAAVNISRFFMKTALVFMICAGPLQWVSLAIDHYIKQGEVTLLVTLTHPGWDPTYGDVVLVNEGKLHEIVNKPYEGKYKNNDEIQLNAGKVAQSMRTMRAQILELTNSVPRLKNSARPDAETIANFGG